MQKGEDYDLYPEQNLVKVERNSLGKGQGEFVATILRDCAHSHVRITDGCTDRICVTLCQARTCNSDRTFGTITDSDLHSTWDWSSVNGA